VPAGKREHEREERMTPEPTHDAAFDENIDRFSSDELIHQYTDRATAGLFPQEEQAIDRYFTETGARVLDVGCGAGRTTRPLAERGFDVTGIDLSEEMIQAARGLFPGMEFRVADATDLGFGSDRFDYVLFSHNGIDYIHPEQERKRALSELRRVLKPDGILVFSSHNAWYRFPALLADHTFLRTFYLNKANAGRLFDRRKIDVREANLDTYMSDPLTQRHQLRECGFELLEVVGKRRTPLKYFEAMPYFVARS
jgi:SAM-dependent methyltransferase